MMKNLFVRWSAVLLTCALIFTLPAWGNDAQSSEAQTLETMVVTSGRIQEKKADVTTNITVLTRADIEQPGIRDLSDLLAKEGFMVREYPNSTISVGMRGFRTETHGNDLASHILILVNGRRAGTGNIAKLTMDNVERVEIIRGPGSVQYGASAMGGVINIITKQGEGKPSFFAEGTLGSWDFKEMSAGVSGGIKGFDYSVSASRASQDDYDTAEGDRYKNTGYDAKDQISLNTGYTFAPGNRIGVMYSDYEGDRIGSPDRLADNNPDKYVDHGISSFDLVYDGRTQDGFLSWNLRYFKGKDEYKTFDPTKAKSMTYYRDTDHQGAQAQITADWEIAHLTAGMDWTEYEISNSYSVPGKMNAYDNPAAFIMAKAHLLDNRLILSAGGRYDKYEVESDKGKTKDETNWSKNAGAVYKFCPQFSVRANYAEAFRMPTADQLYMYNDYSSWGMGIWSGNPDLQPEKSKTYEIGMDFRKNGVTAGLTYFYSEFEDKIGYRLDPATNITRYENMEGATISGVEGSVRWDMGACFGWAWQVVPYGSFTAYTEYEDDKTGKNLQYTPEWTASYGVKLAMEEYGFTSRLNLVYMGEHDITDYAKTGEKSLPAYTIADLTLSKELFSLKKYGKITLNAEISNLFDKAYAVVQGYPSAGRTFYAGLKYDF